ncbi:MAG: hydroxymethylbilane synthase [Psychrilyobacter sp.]|uniref:hydroxymethylbilane synthase n=1 Tax=Psychrilyobacter sp. TaxID=2586924 RepID=UPI003C71173F
MQKKIIIGTRASILAVAQAELTKKMLLDSCDNLEVEIKKIITSGDKDQRTNWNKDNKSLKDMFVKEIERALLDGDIHLAVHSMKDMPAISPKGLTIGAIPMREDNRDIMITNSGVTLDELPQGSIIGTSSLRRVESIRSLRPDLVIEPIRGNIHTRIEKLKNENFDGIVLAYAGLKRVGLKDLATEIFDFKRIMPAPAQGALCIQCREGDKFTLDLLDKINHKETNLIIGAEREFSKIFGGGCTTPMGCYAVIDGDSIKIHGMYFHGDKIYKDEITGDKNNGKELAVKLAKIIRGQIDG